MHEAINTAVPVDMESRHIIEALRSGIPSRIVGRCFSDARPKILKELSGHIEDVCERQKSAGMIISGKYGEGKTHLLNTVFNMASENNMVVSYLSLSKETPMDKLHLLYPKLMANTYLPKRLQPGFAQVFDTMTAGSRLASEMISYAAGQLQTDKLYYLLRACLNTEDAEEKFQLLADLEGDFIANATLRQIYKRIFNQTVKYNVNFSKTKHCRDYFAFMSHFFVQLGFSGWVILIDEGELMGRLSKKGRLNAYRNMAYFLFPQREFESVFSLFAYSASYVEDVVIGKHDFENLEEIHPAEPEPMRSVLGQIVKTPQLSPLTEKEIREILEKVREIHGRAYRWDAGIDIESLVKASQNGGYLLRTRIRAAIELLDQEYQYGEAGEAVIGTVAESSYEEENGAEET
ncbi:MAG: DUF2791 family P-loop domain-containing protein [Lachnospiraceae bacterium]|jgi:hypothetical protein|nr:DUF2791 family P-loop domain-containing protein [Lachnospiraceae bacterium]